MTLQNYLLFVGASLILCLVPGPDMLLLLTRTIAHGRRAGIATAAGINVGGYVHLTAAVLGLSAILATSATAFNTLKALGAIYMVYLGLRALVRPGRVVAGPATEVGVPTSRACFWQGFLSNALNPKVALFFLALLACAASAATTAAWTWSPPPAPPWTTSSCRPTSGTRATWSCRWPPTTPVPAP